MVATLFPELEGIIFRLLEMISHKIKSERTNIIEILKNIEWSTKFRDDIDRCTAIGVDSSFTVVESRIGMIYVIQGVAIRQSFNRSTIKIEEDSRFYDIGLISVKPSYSNRVIRRSVYKRALSVYAYLLELQSAYNLLAGSSADIVLLDGSLLSFLIQKEFKNLNITINSVGHAKDIEIKYILERKMELIKELDKTTHTVFIAKSSGASFYINNGIYPDIYIFELAKLFRVEPYYKAGYSIPMVIEIDKTLRRFLGIDESCEITFITVAYSRFIDNAPIFQLTFPNKVEADTVGSIFSYIKTLSPSGYPMPLEYPHRISKLARGTIIDVFMKLGIPVISGRELIEL